ncbi:tyrosine-type recombinase/integrase [bacterium]|nr:tyrosine-type recombinase/integrase [bacterium]
MRPVCDPIGDALLSDNPRTIQRRTASELLRLRLTDLDLVAKRATIHEKKRVRGKVTTRSVPLSSFLVGVLQAWLQIHPGAPYLFSHEATVFRSKKRSPTTGH